MTVLAAQHWNTNAKMMADVAKLWIDLDNDYVLDPTHGKGGFWKKVRPVHLRTGDLDPRYGQLVDEPELDFRDLPYRDDNFDVVTYDPAYVVPGGRATSTVPKFNEQYGLTTTKMTLGEQWRDVIVPGAEECSRVLRPGGLLMWKCQNYISSGRYHNYQQQVTYIMEELLQMGVVDQFVYVRKAGGPQPGGRRQIHARNNYSVLIIARKAA